MLLLENVICWLQSQLFLQIRIVHRGGDKAALHGSYVRRSGFD